MRWRTRAFRPAILLNAGRCSRPGRGVPHSFNTCARYRMESKRQPLRSYQYLRAAVLPCQLQPCSPHLWHLHSMGVGAALHSVK